MNKTNYFSNKMAEKSDEHLRNVLLSDNYVDDAKHAAAWELERRGIWTNFKPKEKKENKKSFRLPRQKIDSKSKNYYQNRLLAFGVGCIISAVFFFLPDLITTKDSIIPLTGTVRSTDIYVDNVSSRNRMGYEAKSRRARLIFYLNEYQKKFELSENIGQDYSHKEFSNIRKGLIKSNKATIWIRDSDEDEWNPKVFQIDINDKTVLQFDAVKKENGFLFIFLLIVGTASVLLVLYQKYPARFKQLVGA